MVEEWLISSTNLEQGWPLIYSYCHSFNKPLSTPSLPGTESESTKPTPSRYTWEGLWIKCTHHWENEAGGRLLGLEPDWECTISKNIPKEKPCWENGRATKEFAAPPTPHPQLQKHSNKDWQSLPISLSALRLTSGRETIWLGPGRVWRPQELSEAEQLGC